MEHYTEKRSALKRDVRRRGPWYNALCALVTLSAVVASFWVLVVAAFPISSGPSSGLIFRSRYVAQNGNDAHTSAAVVDTLSASTGLADTVTQGGGLALPLRTPTEPYNITIVIIACDYPSDDNPRMHHGMLIKSILMAKAQSAYNPPWYGPRPHYDFHLVVDTETDEFWARTRLNREVHRAFARDEEITLTTHQKRDLEAAGISVGMTAEQMAAVPVDIFKRCAAARLKVPFLLHSLGIKKALYIDYDSLALCDLTGLWHTFESLPASALFAAAPMDPSHQQDSMDHYKVMDAPRHPVHQGINTGVMLLHVERIMAFRDQYWDIVQRTIAARVNVTHDAIADYWALTGAFPLGDQDIYNIVWSKAHHPEWLHPLPFNYNFCKSLSVRSMQLQLMTQPLIQKRTGQRRSIQQVPCILHFCGSRTHNSEKPWRDSDPWFTAYRHIRYWPLDQEAAEEEEKAHPEVHMDRG